jgi:hypothetical protein
MNLNALLEIIISLVALYWLLSTACSYFVEAINSLLINVRAKALERFVCEMVLGVGKVPQLLRAMPWFSPSNLGRTQRPGSAGSSTDAGSLADPLGLFSHGLIQSLRKPQLWPGSTATSPSYIPSKVFAQALLDRLDTLSWSVAPPMASAAVVAGALRSAVPLLGAPWKAALAEAQGTSLQAAPLLAMVTALLGPLNDMTVSQARRELSGLLMDLRLPSTQFAVGQTEAVLAAQQSPAAVLAHLVRILEAAAGALEALPDLDKIDPMPMHTLVGAEALWLLAVRKAGEALVVDSNPLGTLRLLLVAAPLPVSLQQALRPLLAQANFDADKLRAGIESWYDATMERASGWFRRNVTVWLGIFGLVAAVGLNVNSIQVARDLAADPVLRHEGVALAEQLVREQGRPVVAQQIFFKRFGDKQGWQQCIDEALARVEAGVAHSTAPASAAGGASPPSAPSEERRCAWFPGLPHDTARLTGQMRHLLLSSGSLLGVSTRVEGLAPNDELSDEAGASLREALCKAMLDTQVRAGPDREAATRAQAGQAAAVLLKTWPACAWIEKHFADARTGEKFVSAFWAAPQVVWHVGLSKALQELDSAGRPEPAAADDKQRMAQAWRTVAREYALALGQAGRIAAQATAFLDRLPFIGRPADWLKGAAGLSFQVVFLDVLGWLITAVMVSFGAPFWFDLMSKLVNKRATGPKPESTV